MKVFYDDNYTAAAHAFDTTRKSALVAGFVEEFDNVELTAPRPATPRELALVHDPQYVKAVRTGKGAHKSSAGFPWDPDYWTAVSASTGGAVDAALTALKEGVAGSLSSGLHHAMFDRGAGFCTFNGLALAAKMALGKRPLFGGFRRPRRGKCKKVLILDLDAHCGGGTVDIIEDDPRIWQTDISTCSFDGYVGHPERHHLHVVKKADDYLDLLELELERAAEIGFDLVIYNAGMDPHEDCSIGGLPGITSEVIRRREEMVFAWGRKQGVPIAFVLAGGYTGFFMWEERLSALHGMTVAAAAQAPMPDIETIEANAPARPKRRNIRMFDDGDDDQLGLDAWFEEAANSARIFEQELLDDMGLYSEPWSDDEDMGDDGDDGSYDPDAERIEYRSIHELPQEFFDVERDDLRELYPEFFD